jgi:hypothetical protein
LPPHERKNLRNFMFETSERPFVEV